MTWSQVCGRLGLCFFFGVSRYWFSYYTTFFWLVFLFFFSYGALCFGQVGRKRCENGALWFVCNAHKKHFLPLWFYVRFDVYWIWHRTALLPFFPDEITHVSR